METLGGSKASLNVLPERWVFQQDFHRRTVTETLLVSMIYQPKVPVWTENIHEQEDELPGHSFWSWVQKTDVYTSRILSWKVSVSWIRWVAFDAVSLLPRFGQKFFEWCGASKTYIYIFIYKEYNISYLDHEPGKSNVKHLSLFVAQALLHHEAAVTYMYLQVCKKSTWKESKQTWTTRTHISLVFGKNHEVCVCAKALSNCCTRKTINFNELMTQIVPFGAALSTVGWMTRPRYPSMNQACRMKGIISYDIMT